MDSAYRELLINSMSFVKDRYLKIIKVNFTDETFVPISITEGENYCEEINKVGTISRWFDCVAKSGKIHADDLKKFKTFANIEKLRNWIKISNAPIYCSYRRKFGNDDKYKYVSASVIRDKEYSEGHETAYVFVKNIHELYQQEYDSIIEEIGTVDKQTGLLNRTAYNRDVEKYRNTDVGVVFADLNGLKHINDTKGHTEGDKLISNMAKLLSGAFPDYKIYHISGDEFVVLAFNVSLRLFLQRAMSWHRWLWRQECIPLASVGYALDKAVKDITELVGEAEQAMYIDKEIFYEKYPEYKR